jgi:hypothetical protein
MMARKQRSTVGEAGDIDGVLTTKGSCHTGPSPFAIDSAVCNNASYGDSYAVRAS